LQRFLTQPFAISEAFTGRRGARVPISETLTVCERILQGHADRIEEHALYMRGGLADFDELSASAAGTEVAA
jgi:F-type H+-transporting ATPase subunit beta